MKTLNLLIITIVLIITMLTFNIAFVEGYNYPALFMKSNSTAKMYVDFTFSIPNNKTCNLYPHFTGLDTPNPPTNLTVVETLVHLQETQLMSKAYSR